MLPKYGFLRVIDDGKVLRFSIGKVPMPGDPRKAGWWIETKDGWSGPWDTLDEAHAAKRTPKESAD